MTIKLDLMELADFTRPKQIANEIIKQNPQIKLPISLEEVAQAAGISDIKYMPLDGLEGALVANEEKSEGKIVISNRAIPSRRRFTLGHELGHFLIPRHGHNMKCTIKDLRSNGNSKSKVLDIEAEANMFSSTLLMPPQLIRSRKLLTKVPSIENILNVKEICDVSFQACANNYINLHGDFLAMVYSKDKKITYGLNAEEHPLWLNAKKGTHIPARSLTYQADLTQRNTRIADEVDSSIWFDENKRYEIPESLIEEVYIQEDGYASTLLWFDQDIEEKDY